MTAFTEATGKVRPDLVVYTSRIEYAELPLTDQVRELARYTYTVYEFYEIPEPTDGITLTVPVVDPRDGVELGSVSRTVTRHQAFPTRP